MFTQKMLRKFVYFFLFVQYIICNIANDELMIMRRRRQRMMTRRTTILDTAFQHLIPAKLSLQLQEVLKYVDAILSVVLKSKLSNNELDFEFVSFVFI